MSKVICVNCDSKMEHERSGVYVLETYEDGERPYKVWSADYYKCNTCENEVVTGFGNMPFSGEYDSNFQKFVEKCEFKFK